MAGWIYGRRTPADWSELKTHYLAPWRPISIFSGAPSIHDQISRPASDCSQLWSLLLQMPLKALSRVKSSRLDLTLSAALILQIRLAMAERNAKTAFEAGCGLIRSLCYLSVSTKFELAANAVWQVTVQGVLAGLHDGEFVIQKNEKAFWLMSQWLCERRNDLRRIARGTLFSEWPEPEWGTIVDVLHAYVIAFSTPGADASAQLIDALQGSRLRRSDVGEYEYVEAVPLFRAVGIAQKKGPRPA
jgi:hypothetical protein